MQLQKGDAKPIIIMYRIAVIKERFSFYFSKNALKCYLLMFQN